MSLNVNKVTVPTEAVHSTKDADETKNTENNKIIEAAKPKYSEEELQLLDFDGDGEISEEEINSAIALHDKEMEKISNEYDNRHPEETSYAWANKGAWSKEKEEYMNAQNVLYKEAHPEYKLAENISFKNKIRESISSKSETSNIENSIEKSEASANAISSSTDGKDKKSVMQDEKNKIHNSKK